jgi:di/tricarboxylate transporter
MDRLRRILNRCKSTVTTRWRFACGWARDGKALWTWIAVAAALIAVPALWTSDASDQVRWAGMLLQFAGLFAVARAVTSSSIRKPGNKVTAEGNKTSLPARTAQ